MIFQVNENEMLINDYLQFCTDGIVKKKAEKHEGSQSSIRNNLEKFFSHSKKPISEMLKEDFKEILTNVS